MSDSSAEKKEAAPKKGGFFKAMIGTIAGLMSGAFMMYLSPLIEKAVKPSKPVANFAVDLKGLTVMFHNRSSTRGEGWWDFGDGSPLEPVTAEQDSVTHTYVKPGTYTVKLSVRNLLNEESERTVTVNLEPAVVEPPAIVSLEAVPVSANSFAPATFRLVSRTQNAALCVWELDSDRPLEFVSDPPADQERLVTFTEPGGYVIKMAAVNGKKAQERSVIVNVEEPPTGMLTAVLNVSEQMTKVERSERAVTVTEGYTGTADKQNIKRAIPARQGYEVVEARLEPITTSNLKNLQVKVAADRKSALLTGELLKPAAGLLAKGRPAQPTRIDTRLVEEKHSPLVRPATPVTAALSVPGSAVLSLPAMPSDCVNNQRQYRLELRDGDRVIWHESRLPQNVPVTIQNRRCTLTATPIGDQVRIDLLEIRPGTRLSAN
ncbi:MAG: PKD domain-containing protein [Planctomycetia bacterium]|nr:PKD domain-containing protein [Planctomycetia bacterium]